jgi:tRNA dimethylallyltransferase
MGKPIFIAGPTASGKSAVAIEVAKKKGGEIISVDSMQVYCGLDIGTAKPTAEERAAVTHHLVDAIEIDEVFDAAKFVKFIRTTIKKIAQPIFCGGTGLYFKAWQEGLGTSPGGEPKLRAELEGVETEALLQELQRKDPETHAKIDKKNKRRIVRAVEVIRLTDKPFSEQRAVWRGKAPENFFVLAREREDLRKRINARVEVMFEAGLVAETCSLRLALKANAVARQALGYRQVIEHLQGERDLPDTVARVKSRTWQFARRQMTWFRKMDGTHTLNLTPGEAPKITAQRIVDQLT